MTQTTVSAHPALVEGEHERDRGGTVGLEPGTTLQTQGRTITEADLVGFAALTGDRHPIHTDARWAAGSAFGERIAHGMLLLSYAVGLLPLDPERAVALRGFERVAFKRPVRIGDTINVSAAVVESTPAGDGVELVSLDWRILNQRDQLVARARAQLLWRTARGGDPTGALPEEDLGAPATGEETEGPPAPGEEPEGELNRVNGLPAL